MSGHPAGKMRKALLCLAVFGVLGFFPGETSRHGSGSISMAASYRDTLKVATLNLYVGFDLSPLTATTLDRTDPESLDPVLSRFYGLYSGNRPRERLSTLAQELATSAPDIIGLQEAVALRLYGLSADDYLTDLIRKIAKAGGPDYDVLSLDTMTYSGTVSMNSLPIPLDFRDRSAVLYRRDLNCAALDAGVLYASSRLGITVLGNPVTLNRGAIGLKCKTGRQSFYLYNTHLDVGSEGKAQEAQAKELIAYIRQTALDPEFPVIITGDFNASEDLARTRTVAILRDAGFIDSYRRHFPDADKYPGLTCCQREDLRNAASQSGSRYDYVWFAGALTVKDAGVFAATPFVPDDGTAALWPSDHFGVMAEFGFDAVLH